MNAARSIGSARIRANGRARRPSAHERQRDHDHATEGGHRSHAASQPVSTASNRSLPELALDFPDGRDRQAVLRARIQQVGHVIAAGLPEPLHSARLAQSLRAAVLRSGMHGPRDGGRHTASDATRTPTLRCMTVSARGVRQSPSSSQRVTAKWIKRRRSGDAPSQRLWLIGQRSALAHFADSNRTSRRVRGAPNNGLGGTAALVTAPVGT
jgi:hypothetical protein